MSYRPDEFDIVVLRSYAGCEELEEVGITLNEHYTITYLFADGSVVLHKETWLYDTLDIQEYIIGEDSIKLFSLVSDEELEYSIIDTTFTNELMNVFNYEHVKHDFKVGEYVYFTDLSNVSFSEELGFETYTAYEIIRIDSEFNMPIVQKEDGEDYLMLLSNELEYITKCHPNEFGNEQQQIDDFLMTLIDRNFDNNLQKSIDIALECGNIKLLKEIHNEYLEGGKENALRKVRNGET